MGKLFGTDGVRGIANEELTNELAYKLGRFGAYVLSDGEKKAKILVGKDTRVSGDMLESAIISGILSAGCDVIKVGVLPTPAIAYLVRHFDLNAGVMISASHNPLEYNGIKFFNKKGFKLSDEIENQIEDYIINDKDIENIPIGEELGRKTQIYHGMDIYSKFIKATTNMDFKGLRVAIDCANGAASEVAYKTLRDMGATLNIINNAPDGFNINKNCGSTHMAVISNYTREVGADIGISFDGDGVLIDGDKIMAICGTYLKNKGKLRKNTIVTTVMSNIGFDIACKDNGMKNVKTQVGDRYVLKKMVENGYDLGGEQSGHIIFLEHNTTGDALLTAVQLLSVLKKRGQKMSEISKMMKVYPQVLKNAKVSNKTKFDYDKDEIILESIKKVEEKFSGEGRVLIRASGTEPLVRVMIEGENYTELESYADELVAIIEERLK